VPLDDDRSGLQELLTLAPAALQGHPAGVTTDALRAARQEWAHAHIELDTCLTAVIPAALAADQDGGEELQRLLTPEQSHEIARLYGRAVGAWASYRELLRHGDAGPPGSAG
jgi:hypothetical protein